jgi:hypothetical protein
MGIGTATVAHAAAPVAQTDVVDDTDDDESWIEENLGLFGLLGLLGLAGLGGRGGGRKSKGGGGGYNAPRAPKGGHTTDWSSR